MNTRMHTKTFLHKTAALLLIAMLLFAALPAAPAGAESLTIMSAASGTWEATAWPDTLRSGTILVTVGSQTVTGTGTAFTTELSVGNKLKTTGGTNIGTVASIVSDTELTLSNIPNIPRDNIAYHVQGVGPADNAIIANGHTVTIVGNPVNQTGAVTVDAGGTLIISDTAVFSTLTVNGTVSASANANFGALIVNDGGSVDAGGTATTIVHNASSLTINSGGTATISRDFAVAGTTSISGTINFSSNSANSRAMTFTGPVTLNSGAIWSEPASGNGANNTYTFSSDFTNNATTFLAASPNATHSFNGASINGSANTVIAKVDVAGTYTNNGILTVGSALSGTGALTNSAGGTLTLGGSVSIATLSNAGTLTKTGNGSTSTALANFTNTGTITLDGSGTITGGITNNAGGVVNIANSGAIAAFDNATATSVLNISDLTPPTITALTVTSPGNIVNYNGEGDQTVKSIAYNNLIFSGSGNKLIGLATGSTLTNESLSITGTAKASMTGQNLVVNSLYLASLGKVNGTWGSNSSSATNKSDTFFAGTGSLNVTTDSRLSQTINFTSTPPANAGVGGTYTPTASATSALTVTFTIDPSASSVCSINAGEVTFNANGTCIINANQAGDTSFHPAPQVQQSVVVKTNQTIEFTSSAPTEAEVAGTYTPTATATSGLTVTLTIDPSASAVCAINAGVVSFKKAGTCVINANQAGDADFNPAAQVQQSFLVRLRRTNVHVSIAGTEMPGSPFIMEEGTSTIKKYTGLDKGPVKVQSTGPARAIMAAERVVYSVNGVNTSFSDMMGLPNNQLYNAYWLPWYNNVSMNSQLRISNVSATTATVRIWIGGQLMPGNPFTLAPGLSTIKVYVVNQGPVKIVSDVNILVSERVIAKGNGVNTSFSELIALPQNRLNKVFWLPRYTNNQNQDSQLQIANASTSTATVRIWIGGTAMGSSFTVAPGASVSKTYPGIDKGPVKIVSNVNIVASERVIYKLNTVPVSYSELMALPHSQLDRVHWLPWYTNNTNLNTQLQFANVTASPATVRVFINGTEMTGSPFTLAPGASVSKAYPGINKGPVKIVSNVNIVVSAREIFKVNGKPASYSEMMALANKLLDTTYWLPWYNNKTMNSQLLFGMR